MFFHLDGPPDEQEDNETLLDTLLTQPAVLEQLDVAVDLALEMEDTDVPMEAAVADTDSLGNLLEDYPSLADFLDKPIL